jgi:hypothetical protein
MSSARSAGALRVRKQRGMRSCNLEVVRLGRDRYKDSLDERASRSALLPLRELDADEELGGRNRRNRHVVFIGDQLVERCARTLRGHQDRRIEDQAGQRRSSTESEERSSCSSEAQRSSGGDERSSFFTALPFAA